MTNSRGDIPAVARLATRPRALKFFIGLAVSATLIALIAQRTDFRQVGTLILDLSWRALATASLLLTLDFAAKIARWHLMLAPVAPANSWRVSAQTLIASIALNNLLPLRAGDAARVFAFRDALQAPASTLLPLLVLERLLDTAMLIVLAAAVLIPIESAGLLPNGFEFVKPLAAAVVAVMAVLAIFSATIARRLKQHEAALTARLPIRARDPFTRALAAIAPQLTGRQATKLIALTALAWLLEGAMFCVLAGGFHFPQPLLSGALACALATLSSLIPSAPGAFGTFHAAAIAAVTLTGATSTDSAAAYAIVVHAFMWLPLTLIGIACFAALTLKSPAPPKDPT